MLVEIVKVIEEDQDRELKEIVAKNYFYSGLKRTQILQAESQDFTSWSDLGLERCL